MSIRVSLLLAVTAGAGLPAAAQERPAHRVDAHASYSDLSGGLDAWQEATATYSAELSRDSIAAMHVETHRRFGVDERFAELRLSRRLQAGTLHVAVGSAGKGIFKPRFSLRADYETDLGGGGGAWKLLAGGGASWFDGNEALALKLGVEKRLTTNGWSGRAQLVAIADRGGNSPIGYNLRVSGPVSPSTTLSVSYSEVAEPEQLEVVKVEGWSASLVFEIDDHWQWRLDGASEERGSYFRDELGIGVARRF